MELKVSASTVGMSQARLSAAQELEVQMAHQDKVIEETGKARNDVESYIYATRDDLIGNLREFITDAEKSAAEEALTAAEDWLYYGDGYDAQKSVYVEKLKDLKKKCASAVYRQAEAAGRAHGVSALKTTCEEYKKWLVSSETDEKYAHIGAEAKAAVRRAVEETEKWLYDTQDAQAKLTAQVDPVLTTEALGDKRRKLVELCQPVLSTPKPKPPPKEPSNSNEASGEDVKASAAEGGGGSDEAKSPDAATPGGAEGKDADAKPSASDENAAAGEAGAEAKDADDDAAAAMDEDK